MTEMAKAIIYILEKSSTLLNTGEIYVGLKTLGFDINKGQDPNSTLGGLSHGDNSKLVTVDRVLRPISRDDLKKLEEMGIPPLNDWAVYGLRGKKYV